jgi:fructose-specific phosphotransferase system IIC component
MGKIKKAWAGGVAGAVIGASSYAWGKDGTLSGEIAGFIGATVVGFVGGFIVVFMAPKNQEGTR